ncbi:glycosyltransferase family 2 protein [Providencia hangzhouensis]|uniref:glycosyltransferase family 2 protein n=1 Tax=Providencia hangzhouensis TaxID=3031799 RepID=UPI0034DCDBEE
MSISFSVVIPYYNKQYSINRAVNSCLSNSYIDEVIIIDDGSVDEVIIDSISERVKVYKKENGGVSSARNFGINKANSPFIILLDADDELLPSFSSKLMQMIEDNPNGSLYALNYFLGKKGTLRKNRRFVLNPFNYVTCLKYNIYPFCSSSVCINRDRYLKFPSGVTHGEDIITWLRYYEEKGIVYSNEMHSIYHFDDEGSAVSSSGVNLDVISKYILFLNDKDRRIVLNRFILQSLKRFILARESISKHSFNYYSSLYQTLEYIGILLISKLRGL